MASKKRNTVNDRKFVGGMIAGNGFYLQDCASIKYLFLFLDQGLQEISFESQDDFCLVVNDKKINVQVKNVELTISFVNSLLKEIPLADKNIIVGSSCDDIFRNLIRYRERYLNIDRSVYYDDKNELKDDWENLCKGKMIDKNLFLHTDYDVIDVTNQKEIAIASIAKWAENNKIIINTEETFDELKKIAEIKRCECGNLTSKEIINIVNKHRDVRIGIMNTLGTEQEREIVSRFEKLIVLCPFFASDLLAIKYSIEKTSYVEAEALLTSLLAKGLTDNSLQEVRLWLLNRLGRYEELLGSVKAIFNKSDFVLMEEAKAYCYLGRLDDAKKCVDVISEDLWDEDIYLLYSSILESEDKIEECRELLKKCIKKYEKSMDALYLLAKLSTPEEAVEYYERIRIIDDNSPLSYIGLADISEEAFDYETAYMYYTEYLKKDKGIIPFEIYAKLVVLGYVCKKSIDIWLIKLNRSYREQNDIIGISKIALPFIDKEYTLFFSFVSKERGYDFLLNNELIAKSLSEFDIFVPGIGAIVPGIDYYMHSFINGYSSNPVKTSQMYSIDEAAVPGIYLYFNTLEAYEKMREKLIKTGKVHLNHRFTDKQFDYVIDGKDIEVDLLAHNGELDGTITVGEVKIFLYFKETSIGFDNFNKQLNKNSGLNEAAIDLVYKDEYATRLVYKKKNISLQFL